MAEFSLLKFDGKPLEKLLDVVGNFIGIANKPRQIRKEADAEAYATKKLAEAKVQALEIEQKAEEDRLDRAQERIHLREIMRQNNIEAVASNAAEVLKIESHVSDEPVDKDWTARFFNIVEDISDEQMQQLWGRILAGEVKRPKSFSLHTLEVLRNLSKEEADLFAKATHFIIKYSDLPFIFKSDNNDFLTNYGLEFIERILLIELGLITAEKDIILTFESESIGSTCFFVYGKYNVRAIKKKESKPCDIPIYKFTIAGAELAKLLPIEVIDDYFRGFCS